MLSETNHRCSNDLQLIVGLLALQAKRAASPEIRQALADAIDRISILSRARKTLYVGRHHSLISALQQVIEALHVQVEIRSIHIYLNVEQDVHGLSERQITTIALIVNELATNAIKHAFAKEGSGDISVSVSQARDFEVAVAVEDNGLPFAEAPDSAGIGISLVKRLVASISGVLVMPPPGTKVFELRVPIEVA